MSDAHAADVWAVVRGLTLLQGSPLAAVCGIRGEAHGVLEVRVEYKDASPQVFLRCTSGEGRRHGCPFREDLHPGMSEWRDMKESGYQALGEMQNV